MPKIYPITFLFIQPFIYPLQDSLVNNIGLSIHLWMTNRGKSELDIEPITKLLKILITNCFPLSMIKV